MQNETLAIETRAGKRRTIRNSAVPVKSDAGEMPGAILLNEDVTDRIRTEKALHHGSVLKEIDSAALLRAVHTVAEGDSVLDPTVTKRAPKWLRDIDKGSAHPEAEPLPPQEEQVLALAAEIQTNKEIAAALSLSDKTINNYLANVFQKLRVRRRAQAAAFFRKEETIAEVGRLYSNGAYFLFWAHASPPRLFA